jgi:hypothetical protein
MKRLFLTAGLLFCLLFPLSAQSNQIMDEILAEPALTAPSAAYLLLSAADGAAQPETREQALQLMAEDFAGTGDTLTMGEFSLLVQKQFDLPRGLASRLFGTPRYALRDLKFQRIIQGRAHPSTPLSGERALRIIGRVLSGQEVQL